MNPFFHPDISLITANYNNGNFLNEFIDSILASSVIPGHIILVDDGSTDNSTQILRQYLGYKPFELIFLPDNQGFANALNLALDRVKSPFTVRADPDDILLPDKIEKQLEFLLKHPEIAGVGCNVAYFHSASQKVLHVSNFPIQPEKIRKTYLKGEHGIQHPTLMIRTDVIRNFRYAQSAVPAEDYFILAQMIKHGYNFANLKEPLYKMRIHPQSSSSRLRFSTVQKTYHYRDVVFGTNTSFLKKLLFFVHIKNYRNFMLSTLKPLRYFYLFMAVLFYPAKAFKRFFR